MLYQKMKHIYILIFQTTLYKLIRVTSNTLIIYVLTKVFKSDHFNLGQEQKFKYLNTLLISDEKYIQEIKNTIGQVKTCNMKNMHALGLCLRYAQE